MTEPSALPGAGRRQAGRRLAGGAGRLRQRISRRPTAPCRLSTKHALALTNRGGATADDVIALARTVRDGVRDVFGITLKPEPVLLGCGSSSILPATARRRIRRGGGGRFCPVSLSDVSTSQRPAADQPAPGPGGSRAGSVRSGRIGRLRRHRDQAGREERAAGAAAGVPAGRRRRQRGSDRPDQRAGQ